MFRWNTTTVHCKKSLRLLWWEHFNVAIASQFESKISSSFPSWSESLSISLKLNENFSETNEPHPTNEKIDFVRFLSFSFVVSNVPFHLMAVFLLEVPPWNWIIFPFFFFGFQFIFRSKKIESFSSRSSPDYKKKVQKFAQKPPETLIWKKIKQIKVNCKKKSRNTRCNQINRCLKTLEPVKSSRSQ